MTRLRIPFSPVIAGLAASLAAAIVPDSVHNASERKTVDITVYNSNTSLVREERIIQLIKGENRVVVPDIPATIEPTSLHFSSLTDAASVRVLEQNYQYDLVSQTKLLEKYIGKQVEFFRLDPVTKKEYTTAGKLLAVGGAGGVTGPYGGEAFSPDGSNSGIIAEIAGKVEINPVGRLVLPSLPEGLVLKPQLQWLVSATRAGKHRVEISYLASNLTWDCDYVALLNQEDNRIDIKGWVTLINNSGTSFMDAGLKLVAGDVNRVPEPAAMGRAGMAQKSMDADNAPEFKQRELFEYKLYALQRHTDLRNDESKQIELVSAKSVAARKVMVYDGVDQSWRYWLQNPSYRSQESFGQQSDAKVGVYVIFRNDEKSGLGIPLPKGRVRVYKRDEDEREQFIGEDNLDHTPKDEEIRLYLGNAFDVVGSRTQTDFRNLSSGHVIEETFEIKLRNHKKEAVEVLVAEHAWRWNQWEIVKTNTPWEKADQTTMKFPVKIPKDGEKSVIYTIRYFW